MTGERIKGKVAFHCDLKGCNEGIETDSGDFTTALNEARAEGWLTRKRDDVWKHFCCQTHEEMDYRGQSI